MNNTESDIKRCPTQTISKPCDRSVPCTTRTVVNVQSFAFVPGQIAQWKWSVN